MASQVRPEILFVAPVREVPEFTDLERLARDVAAQEAVSAQLLIVDLTPMGSLELPAGVRCVRPPVPSLGRGLELALGPGAPEGVASVPFVAWCDPRIRVDPSRALLQIDRLERTPGAMASTSVMATLPNASHPRVFDGSRAAREVVPFWTAGMMFRREALRSLGLQAFAPVELRLIKQLAAGGVLVGCERELGFVPEGLVEAESELRATDWILDELAGEPLERERPLVSVVMATYQRREVLLECLEGFARQLVPPGWHEMIVVDDGSTDGTRELLEGLELDVPWIAGHQEHAGPASARNQGLERASGELVLFVADDTIPSPDLIDQHVQAHRAHEQPVSILGTFEQPPSQTRSMGMRLLEKRPFVHAYMEFEDGDRLKPERYDACNVSTPLNAVRMVGGFDGAFAKPAAEDTDLGLRLDLAGVPLYFCQHARSEHRHILRFDDVRRRYPLVGRERVRLWARHPALLLANDQAMKSTRAGFEKVERIGSGILRSATRAGEALFALDAAELEAAGGPATELASAADELLEELLTRLSAVWLGNGLLEGLIEHGADDFAELVERSRSGALPESIGRSELTLVHDVPQVSLVALVDDGDRLELDTWFAALRRDLRGGPAFELILVDGRPSPAFELQGGRVIRETHASRGVRLAAGCSAARSEVTVLLPVGLSLQPGAVAAHLEVLTREPGVEMVTAPVDADGFVSESETDLQVRGWWGAALRSHVLRDLPATMFPLVEAKLLLQAEQAGRCHHRVGPAVTGSEQRLAELASRHAVDLKLVELAGLAPVLVPELSVIVPVPVNATEEELFTCLEAFRRQTVAPGTFELLLAFESTARVGPDLLTDYEFPISLVLVQGTGESTHDAAARNRALEHARGRLVLLAETATLPDPECVAHHLAAHEAWASNEPLAVLGSLVQPEAELERPVPRYMEASPDSRSLAQRTPGAVYGPRDFQFGNVSLRRSLLAEVGGLDESFGTAGLADLELGLRLAERGLRVQAVPEARALHAHSTRTAEYERTIARRAEAEVCLFLKHPTQIEGDSLAHLSAEEIARELEGTAPEIEQHSKILSVLGDLPLAPLERLGGEFAEYAACITDSLRQWSPGIARTRRLQGRLEGLRAAGLEELDPVWNSRDPFLLVSSCPLHLFAWPRWDSPASVDALVRSVQPLLDRGVATLVLRHDPGTDPDKSLAFASFERSFTKHYPSAPRLDVLIEDRALSPWRVLALGRACAAWIKTGEEPGGFAASFPSEPLEGRSALEAWLRRLSVSGERQAA